MISILSSDWISSASYLFLALALMSLWVVQLHAIWLGLLFCSTLAGLISGRITLLGIFFEFLFCCVVYLYYHSKNTSWKRAVLGMSLFLFSLCLGMHKVPGFKNWLVLSHLKMSEDALPIEFYLNLDKPLIGLFIVAWGYRRISSVTEWLKTLRRSYKIILSSWAVLLGLSALSGYVRFEPKWFEFSVIWLCVNLLFACIAEEAFFRGFIQKQLQNWLSNLKNGSLYACLISSILFGLVHFRGGLTYIFLATVAGIFYGMAYFRTQRLEASILTHFSVNAIHFLLFTYPALQMKI